MRSLVLISTLLTGVVTGAIAQRAQPGPSCEAEIGQRRAAELLRDCRAVAADPAATCGPNLSCERVTRAVRESCEWSGADAPPACETYVEIEETDDE